MAITTRCRSVSSKVVEAATLWIIYRLAVEDLLFPSSYFSAFFLSLPHLFLQNWHPGVAM